MNYLLPQYSEIYQLWKLECKEWKIIKCIWSRYVISILYSQERKRLFSNLWCISLKRQIWGKIFIQSRNPEVFNGCCPMNKILIFLKARVQFVLHKWWGLTNNFFVFHVCKICFARIVITTLRDVKMSSLQLFLNENIH